MIGRGLESRSQERGVATTRKTSRGIIVHIMHIIGIDRLLYAMV